MQKEELWSLFSDLEVRLIPILSGMSEHGMMSHNICFQHFLLSFLCSVMEVRGIRVNCGKLLHYADLLKVEVNTL